MIRTSHLTLYRFATLAAGLLLSLPAGAVTSQCRAVFAVNVPVVAQIADYTCGVACFRAVVRLLDQVDVAESQLAADIRANARHGSTPLKILRAARERGFDARLRENLSLTDIETTLAAGRPLIALVQVVSSAGAPLYGHWVVIKGIDAQFVYLMDPDQAAAAGKYAQVSRASFEQNWWHRFSGKKVYRHLAIDIGRPEAGN